MTEIYLRQHCSGPRNIEDGEARGRGATTLRTRRRRHRRGHTSHPCRRRPLAPMDDAGSAWATCPQSSGAPAPPDDRGMRARGGVKRQRMGISASGSLVTQLVVSPPPARACAYVVCASVRAYADGCDPGGAVVIPAIRLADVYPCQACSCHEHEVGNAARWAGAGRSPWGTCCCR